MSAEQFKRLSTAQEIAQLLNTSRRMVYYYKGLGMPAKKFGPRFAANCDNTQQGTARVVNLFAGSAADPSEFSKWN